MSLLVQQHARAKPWVASVFVALVMLAALFCAPLPALALTTEEQAVLDSHKVATVDPSGMTMNLYDYWLTTQDDVDNWGDGAWGTGGISSGHTLVFTKGTPANAINRWTNYKDVDGYHGSLFELVENKLVDGYPKLYASSGSSLGSAAAGAHPYYLPGDSSSTAATQGAIADGADESLAYLFDSTTQDGKQAFFGVQGLLQYKDGYYQYDCTQNFASFDEDTKTFSVYDQAAVRRYNVQTGTDGQFFPFNTAEQVFSVNTADNTIAMNDTNNSYDCVNHFFGLSMTARFVMPDEGKAEDGQDMVFEFTGDDDVWVYIDGVLVGDLGGNRNEASLSINFATGEVSVGATNQDSNWVTQKTTNLRELYSQALGSAMDTSDFETGTNTFAADTLHTLSFFYLERGNNASNLKLKFNLVEQPRSDVVKVDQEGNPVEGASFALYRADENYKVESGATPIAQGTTDSTGTLVLVDDNDRNISFDELYEQDSSSLHYRLVETSVPPGYRSSIATGDANDGMALRYIPPDPAEDDTSVRSGIIVDANVTQGAGDNIWERGSYTSARELITTDSTVVRASDSYTYSDEELAEGTLFAVILKRDTSKDLADAEAWTPIYGDELGGYVLAEGRGVQGAAEVARAYASTGTSGTYSFRKKGAYYTCELSNLPGYVMDYYWAQQQHVIGEGETTDASFTVVVYYTSGSLANATEENTARVSSDGFMRQFAANILVTDIKNELYVQKRASDTGESLAGASFELYRESDVTVVDGKASLKAGAEPYDTTTTTNTSWYGYSISGGLFPSDEAEEVGKLLEAGTYYLRESVAPEGYELSDSLVKVIVDEQGAHADAGDANDDVSVKLGVDYLIRAMRQYGTQPKMNATVYAVLAATVTGSEADGVVSFAKAGDEAFSSSNESLLRLRYYSLGQTIGSHNFMGRYVSSVEGGASSAEVAAGWAALSIRQDTETVGAASKDAGGVSTYTELGSTTITGLFSLTTCVVITDKPESSTPVDPDPETPTEGIVYPGIDVTNTVLGREASAGLFKFVLTRVKAGERSDLPESVLFQSAKSAAGQTSTVLSAALGAVRFTSSDIGNTYVYSLSETGSGTTERGWSRDISDADVSAVAGTDAATKAGTAYVYLSVYDAGDGTPAVLTTVVKGEGAKATYTAEQLAALVKKPGSLYVVQADSAKTGSDGTAERAVVPFANEYSATGYMALGLKKVLLGSEIEVPSGAYKIRATAAATAATATTAATTAEDAATFGNRIFESGTDFFDHKALYHQYSVEELRAGDGSDETTDSTVGSYCEMHDLNIAKLTLDDAGKAYTYVVTEDETKTAPSSVTLDPETYTVTIQITDAGDGTIRSVVTARNSAGALVLKNDSASASASTENITGLINGEGNKKKNSVTVEDVPTTYVTVTNHAYGLKVRKVDANSSSSDGSGKTPLKGASFAIYADDNGTPGALVSAVKEATTNDQGVAGIWGIVAGKTYWLVETEAPVGYLLPSKGVRIRVASDGTVSMYTGAGAELVLNTDSDDVPYLTVENVGMGSLPMTGSSSGLVVLGAGVALMALAAFGATLLWERMRGRT